MTTSILPPALPASYSWGFVVGQVIHAIADTTADVDRLPQARAATGTIRFEPLETLRKVTAEPAAFVAHEVVTATLGATGEMVDAEGQVGIWLVTGDYRVSFALSGAAIPSFNITVTAAHTLVAPLDLVTVSPYTPPAGAAVTTLLVPAGPAEGQVLGWASGALTWVAAGAGGGGSAPDATTLTKGIVRLSGDLGGTADAPTVSGLATKVETTDPRLSDPRTPTAHTHDDRYYTEAETDTLLSGKAATGHTHGELHTHANAAALALVSGTNTGDQTLPTWSTIAGKPAVIGAGATAAAARTAIGAGTSDLAIGTTGTTAAAGNRAATEAAIGMVELATTAEATTGTDTTRAVTPAALKAVADTKANASHSHTAAQVTGLAKVATTGAYADLTNKPTIPDSPDDIGAAPATQPINAQTGAYTLTASDAGKLVTVTAATAVDVTVPAGVFTAGQRVDVLDLGTERVTFVAGAGMTLSGTPTLVSRAQYSAHSVVFLSASDAVVVGDLEAA